MTDPTNLIALANQALRERTALDDPLALLGSVTPGERPSRSRVHSIYGSMMEAQRKTEPVESETGQGS